MKKVPLYAEHTIIYPNNAEELENLTDPDLHNPPIKNLKLILLNSFKISVNTIENLKAISPYLITLSDNSEAKDEAANKALFTNFVKLLSKLGNTSLEIDFDEDYFGFELKFDDVIWKVVESKNKCSYIKAKSVVIRCEDEDFCLIK